MLEVCIIGSYEDITKILCLPISDEEIATHKEYYEIKSIETEYYVSNYDKDNLQTLNEIARYYKNIDDETERAIFEAVYIGYGVFEEAVKIYETGEFSYFININDYEDLGKAYVEAGFENIDEFILKFIDYEKLGKYVQIDYVITQKGIAVSY